MDATEIYDRLSRRFGAPDVGSVKSKLYLKLGQIIEAEGDRAYMLVATAAADAAGKEQPDRYFAKTVTARLREHGFLQMPEL